MFTKIEIRNFKSLKFIDQPLGRFHALVGPNASGKTTFLDSIALLSDIMRSRGGVSDAIRKRSSDFQKLVWKGEGSSFQIAVEAKIPDEVRFEFSGDKSRYKLVRYEIEVSLDEQANEIGLDHETLWLLDDRIRTPPTQRLFFPRLRHEDRSILLKPKQGRVSISKTPGGNNNFYPDTSRAYRPSFRLERTLSALANTPADRKSFPVGLWFRGMLEEGVQNIFLDSQVIRRPSPPGLGKGFQTDGSNLPWVVNDLRKDAKRFAKWLEHVRTALEDISDIRTVERPEDRHRYLVVDYANGASVPSWLVSDGTLRLLCLTVLAYLESSRGIFLIEEPENGIHPKAMETVVQSLTSIYRGQVLIASHSQVVINQLDLDQILCFAKDETGATDVVSGDLHPALSLWKHGQPDLQTLFAAGILS